ncbi:alanine racemase [Bacillus sp. 165]|uniref:alanine racemase n=1 Tax=Bacillus sp. 165 TaxID=1529117 RepID=UPI001ADA221F|nr:alanine racemase [Bacillus sp. 165]MBO9131379.1 alanine racemase [Bacillus sp. 165]
MNESSFYRDTWVEVDLDRIYNNVSNMNKHLPKEVEMIAVVKANGYGHGAINVAETAIEAGAARLAVAFLDEALILREAGITVPILVLGASRPEDVNVAAEHNIALTVFQSEWLEQAKETLIAAQSLPIHLKFDSGMGRIGIRTQEELEDVVSMLNQTKQFHVEGAYTHFATSDELRIEYFEQQYTRFTEQLSWLNKLKVYPSLIHCANSAASLRFTDKVFNAVRIGIAMYGLTPSIEMNSLLPYHLQEAFSLHSKIVHVKQIHPGESISYGATYTAEKQEWIATIPIGYADGWIRKLQGFQVLADGVKVPIVGRICMDQLMIRLPYHMPVGTKVTLIGSQKDAVVSVDEVAEYLGTINYEIPCLINFRVPRVFRKDGNIAEVENLLAR